MYTYVFSTFRLSCILLQRFHTVVNGDEIKDIVKKVEEISLAHSQRDEAEKKHGSLDSLNNNRLFRWLSTDNLTSPVSLTQFPQVCSFRPKPYPLHLRPHRTEAVVSCNSLSLSLPPSLPL